LSDAYDLAMTKDGTSLIELSDEAELAAAVWCFRRVFTKMPRTPLQSAMAHRAIIYFDTKFKPDEHELSALVEATRAIGEDLFYVTGHPQT
jgi:hypothetical protein